MGSLFSSPKKKKQAPAAAKPLKITSQKRPKIKGIPKPKAGFQDYEDEYEDEDEEEEFANYPNEPKWMQRIQNSTICNWFYVFYIISLVLFVISLAVTVSGFFARGSKMAPVQAFFSISISAIAAVNTLFYYLICDRSLQP